MTLASPLWLLPLLAVPALVVLTVRAYRGESRRLSAPRALGPPARGDRRPARLTPPRRVAFLLLRSAALLLLALACAGAAFGRLTDALSVVFVVDESRSITPDARARAAVAIETIRGKLRRGDAVGLVRFGADAVATDLTPGAPLPEDDPAVDTGATDIATALQLGLARVGASAASRIVLLTDGNENRGDALRAASVARSMGVPVFPVPLGAVTTGGVNDVEVAVDGIRVPARVRRGEAHEVTVLVRSRGAARARVTLLRDGEPTGTRDVTLTPGENAVELTGVFPARGLHAWDAVVEAAGDGIAQNNRSRVLVEVTGEPQILYVSRPGRGSDALLAALAAQGIRTERRDVAGLPGTLAGYLPYDAIVLDNVSGYGISSARMDLIARYVGDMGGGLAMLGGDNSFGAGGYYKTPIERILPVDMDVKTPVNLPRLSLVILVDKSGSMGGPVAGGQTKLDVAKSAALAAIETLNPFDRVGLLAFDADWEWSVSLTNAGNTDAIASDLATLAPGGGTVLFPALQEAERALVSSTSPLKHVIILTDGLTNPGDFETLAKRMRKEKITVSTVAAGEDSDSALLRDIAAWGNGRSYVTNDPRDVPKIFVAETSLATRGFLVEKSFLPRLVSAGESIRGIDLSAMPALKGYVLTYMKPGAEMVLAASDDAPLLATWRYGLGRTAAFTSDMRGHWGGAWLSWSQFPRFAAQLVRWIERPGDTSVLHPTLALGGGAGRLDVDAWDALGSFVDGLSIRAIVIGPDGKRSELPVPQVAPGRYAASFEAAATGDYIVTLDARAGRGQLPPVTIGGSIPYSEEYEPLGVNTALLQGIAAATGGRVVEDVSDAASLSALLRRVPMAARADGDAWRLLLLGALLLFFADIAVRLLTVPEGLSRRVSERLRALRRTRGLTASELDELVDRGRRAETEKVRARVTTYAPGGIDPEVAAYLYIARMHSRKAAEADEKKGR